MLVSELDEATTGALRLGLCNCNFNSVSVVNAVGLGNQRTGLSDGSVAERLDADSSLAYGQVLVLKSALIEQVEVDLLLPRLEPLLDLCLGQKRRGISAK